MTKTTANLLQTSAVLRSEMTTLEDLAIQYVLNVNDALEGDSDSQEIDSKTLKAAKDKLTKATKPYREHHGIKSITSRYVDENGDAFWAIVPTLLNGLIRFIETGELDAPVSNETDTQPTTPHNPDTATFVTTEIVLRDTMHIDTVDTTTADSVESRLALRRANVPAPVVPVLNGTADSLLQDALRLDDAVNAYEQQIQTDEQALEQRLTNVSNAKELIDLNIDRLKELNQREETMKTVGLELSETEKTERDRLTAELGKLLKKDEPCATV